MKLDEEMRVTRRQFWDFAVAFAALGYTGQPIVNYVIRQLKGAFSDDENTEANFETKVLDNGVTVYLVPKRYSDHSLFGYARVRYGTVNERGDEYGIAHLLEHLIQSSGAGDLSQEEILDGWSKFRRHNASTEVNSISLEAYMDGPQAHDFLHLASLGLFDLKFDQETLNQERARVLEELGMKNTPEMEHNRIILEEIQGSRHPYQRGLGKEIIRAATLDDVMDFYQRGFKTNLTDVFLVGDIPTDIDDLLSSTFGQVPATYGESLPVPDFKSIGRKKQWEVDALDLKTGHYEIRLGWNWPASTDQDVYGLKILHFVLGRSSQSELYKELSVKQGLIYGIDSGYQSNIFGGTFFLEASTSHDSKEVVDEIFGIIEALKSKPIDEQVWRNYQNQLRGIVKPKGLLDNFNVVLNEVDDGYFNSKLQEQIESMNPAKLQQLARKYLPGQDGKYVLMIRKGVS